MSEHISYRQRATSDQVNSRPSEPAQAAGPSIEPLIRRVFGVHDSVRFEAYDGTVVGPEDAPTVVRITSPEFFNQILIGHASELSFGRCYVLGYVHVEGDIYGALSLLDEVSSFPIDRQLLRDAIGAIDLRDLSRSLLTHNREIPPEEVRLSGRLHSRKRDEKAISSHYDVSNDFYELFLDPTMTYSCALFESEGDDLETAQRAKYDLICRKLGLKPGQRLLDIGCGWGGMVLHAAQHFGASAVGVTLSREQQKLAQERVEAAGLADRVEIRFQDYRDVDDGPFDAVSSIGMFEHVGQEQLNAYFDQIYSLLKPQGRLLNHAINRSTGRSRARIDTNGFVARYVFPDGALLEAGQVVSAINDAGLEVRHLESLREHYARTLREWVGRLDANWDEAVAATSLGRARVWRIYMAGSALGFEANKLNLTQVLAVKSADGESGFGLRPSW